MYGILCVEPTRIEPSDSVIGVRDVKAANLGGVVGLGSLLLPLLREANPGAAPLRPERMWCSEAYGPSWLIIHGSVDRTHTCDLHILPQVPRP